MIPHEATVISFFQCLRLAFVSKTVLSLSANSAVSVRYLWTIFAFDSAENRNKSGSSDKIPKKII